MDAVSRAALRAYIDQRDHIADSDLDDEQPVTLQVRTTLGELRRLQRIHRNQTEFSRPGYVADDSQN